MELLPVRDLRSGLLTLVAVTRAWDEEVETAETGDGLAAFVERGWQLTDAQIASVTRTPSVVGRTAGSDDYVVVTEFTLDGHDGYTSVLHGRTVDGDLRIHEHHAYP